MIAPSLFVSHGSPMFAVEPGELGPRLRTLGARLRDRVAAIAIVSAHWQTPQIRLTGSSTPQTIHDFGGFPDELYRLRYPAQGAPAWADRAAGLLREAGYDAVVDERRGLDHGAWVPLRYLAPEGAVPVFQVSLPVKMTTRDAVAIGQALAPLRAENVMVLGSGGLTHNLHEYFTGSGDARYAQAFAHWMHSALSTRNFPQLIDYRHEAPSAQHAHPTEEHFMPLLVAFGASADSDAMHRLDGGWDGVLSMDSFLWDRA